MKRKMKVKCHLKKAQNKEILEKKGAQTVIHRLFIETD
jgi:hypothetical protein